MSAIDTSRTTVRAPLAGRERTFRLNLGEMAELENLCGAGIGEVMLRLGSHRFRHTDIRETVRLGLQGGGMIEPEATAIVMGYVDGRPLMTYADLAASIITAAVSGVEEPSGKAAEREADNPADPATSPPTSKPVE